MADIPGHKDVDAALVRGRLTPWFRRQLADPGAEITAVGVPEGQGFSSETIFVDVQGGVGAQRFVVKTCPEGEILFPVYDLEAQFRCMQLVRAHSDVPAAPVRWLELDERVLGRPFYVMDRVDGVIPPDNLPYTLDGFLLQASPADQRRLYDSSLAVLAGLHRLDWHACGFGFLDKAQFGRVGLEQQLAEGRAYLDWVARGADHPVPEAAIEKLHQTLPGHPPPLGLNWGDSRIGNMIYRDFEPVAVLDWEMALLGPAEVDLGWFLFMHRFFTTGLGVPDLPGFPSEDEAIATYEALLGRPVHDLDWYLLWAGLRYGVIMVRLIQIQTARSGEAPEPGWTEHDNLAIALLASML